MLITPAFVIVGVFVVGASSSRAELTYTIHISGNFQDVDGMPPGAVSFSAQFLMSEQSAAGIDTFWHIDYTAPDFAEFNNDNTLSGDSSFLGFLSFLTPGAISLPTSGTGPFYFPPNPQPEPPFGQGGVLYSRLDLISGGGFARIISIRPTSLFPTGWGDFRQDATELNGISASIESTKSSVDQVEATITATDSAAPVPEPSTTVMLATLTLTVLGIGSRRRRRARATADD